jgi:hypothetical protein
MFYRARKAVRRGTMRTLLSRIQGELQDQKLDHGVFETVALGLLRPSYPTLAPITGGSDDGRDADAADEDGVVRVLATTAGDVERNLKDGLSQLANKGHDHACVIIVTSQPVSATRRRKLSEMAEERGAALVEVHDRSWLALALHDVPDFRRELLDITGDPPALVEGKVVVRRLGLVEAAYVGREDELQKASDASEGDVVVVGRAGSGKTRFAAELDGALFANTDAPMDRIADDIRALAPETVVVDDGGRSPAVLRGLVALREDDASFRIVTTVWPEELDVVTEHLPSAGRIDLPLLERAEGADLLRGLGIANEDLIGLILDQAEGRAGWLALLGTLAIRGDVRDLVEGVELGKQLRRFARRAASHLPVHEDAALDVLGAASLMGQVPDAGARAIADLSGLPHSSVLTTLRCFTDHGLLDYVGSGYRAPAPAIRGAVVAGLLEDPPRLDPTHVLDNTDAAMADVVEVLTYAAHRGADHAKRHLESLAPSALRNADVHRRSGLLAGIVVLSPRLSAEFLDAIEEVVENVVSNHASFRAMHEAWAGALAGAAKIHRDARALDLLLELALAVDGDHNEPLRRVLTEFSSRATRHEGTTIQNRLDVVAAVSRRGNLGTSNTKLPGLVLAGAVAPGGRFTRLDPVEGRSLTLVDYVEGHADLARVTDEVWPAVLAVVENLPVASVIQLLDGLAEWRRAAESDRFDLDDPSEAEFRRHVDRRLRDLREICAGAPALAVEWNQRMRWATTILQPIELALAYRAMLPLHERLRLTDPSNGDIGYEAEARRQTAELEQAATHLRSRGVEDALAQIATWLADHPEAHELRHGTARLIGLLPADGDAAATLAAAMDIPDLHGALGELMRRCLDREPEAWQEWWPRMLDTESSRWEAILVGLDDDHASDELRQSAAAAIGPDDVWRLEHLFTRDATPGGALDLLLSHEAAEVRAAAVVAFSFDPDSHGPVVPAEWVGRWDEAFVVSRPASTQMGEWRWEQLVEEVGRHRPEVLEAHLRHHVADVDKFDPDQDLRMLPIRHLPLARRLAVLDKYRDIEARSSLVKQALLHDADAAVAALGARVVSPDEVVDEVTGEQRGAWFEAVAPALVSAGVNPTRIARMLQFGTWWGDASANELELAEYADELAARDDEALAAVGLAGGRYFRELAESDARREREERVRGRR